MKKPSLSSVTGMSCFYQQYNYHKIPCGTIINHYHSLPVFKIVLEYEDTPEQHSVRQVNGVQEKEQCWLTGLQH